ncbi:type II toxin-antitoxin system HicA family toxin [uncultured Sphingomonas sp.]|uniref:type II toxin-antitoxin system HicA family toxin n=1 Tax=uncultured Sphingomonas sp. TaxID=158754 RepID=UPI0035CC77B1
MPKLPVLPARDIVRGLDRLGFEQISQRGSHLKLRRHAATVIVPMHREVRRGTLASILEQAGVSVDELIDALAN